MSESPTLNMDQRNPIATATATTAAATTTRQSPSAPPLPQQDESRDYEAVCASLVFCVLFSLVVAMPVTAAIVRSSNNDDDIPLRFQIQSVTTPTAFALNTTATRSTTTTVTAAFNITFLIDHLNYGALYGPARVSVYYHHRPQPCDLEKEAVEYNLCSSSLDSLCPGHSICDLYDVQSRVSVTVPASSVPVSDDFIVFLMNQDLNKRGELGITVEISADYWLIDKNQDAKLSVICRDVRIRVPSGVMVNGPSPCEVDLDT